MLIGHQIGKGAGVLAVDGPDKCVRNQFGGHVRASLQSKVSN
jgi:hypothetical protein